MSVTQISPRQPPGAQPLAERDPRLRAIAVGAVGLFGCAWIAGLALLAYAAFNA